MASTNITRRTFTDLSEAQQVRELNRQMEWIWHQLLGGLTEKAFSTAGIQQNVKRIETTIATALEADTITSNVVTAALAEFMVAQIGVASIDMADINDLQAAIGTFMQAYMDAADIDWAHIGTLAADIAEIAKAQITTANIDEANINWANIQSLNSGIATIVQAQMNNATITTAQISDLTTEIANIISVAAQNGRFSFVDVSRLVASAMIITQGLGGTVTIENLVATDAMFIQATLGKLVLKGDDDKYYEMVVAADGTITTEEVVPDAEELSNLEMEDGRRIVETEAAIAQLSSTNISTQTEIAQQIFTRALTAEAITASEAFLATAVVPEMYATVITAIGNSLNLRANESVNTLVGDAVDGLKLGGRNLANDTDVTTILSVTGSNDHMLPDALFPTSAYGVHALSDTNHGEYTVSFDWEIADADAEGELDVQLQSSASGYTSIGGSIPILVNATTLDSSGHFSHTFAPTDGQRQFGLGWRFAGLGSSDNRNLTLTVSNFKLEIGNRESDWELSPEDLGERFDAVESLLQQTKTGLSFITKYTTGTDYFDENNTESDSVDASLGTLFAYLHFDTQDINDPKLLIGSTGAPVQMCLGTSYLRFVPTGGGTALAEFTTERLWVKSIESEKVSVGKALDSSNNILGYMDITVDDDGVAFTWRNS